jgi:hypothetical protein
MRKVIVVALLPILPSPTLSPAAQAQQFDPAQQTMPGYYTGPSPVFPGYQQAPVIGGVAPTQQADPGYVAPAPAYPTGQQYVPSRNQYLPAPGGGLAGSTFRPPY